MSDLINASFELLGSFFVFLSIRQLLRDRQVRGVHWGTTVFFTSWGFWNLFFYSQLGQRWSTAGSVGVCLTNCVYLWLLLRFRDQDTN